MSDVYLRGTVYWCWVKDHTGKWTRKSTGRRDKTAARLEKRRLERMYADPDHLSANETTVEAAVKQFLTDRERRGKAAGTLTMYRQKCGHINRLFGAKSLLATITASRVDWFCAKREEEGASKHTIHKELVALRGLLKVAKRRGEYRRDISEVMPIGYSPEYKPRKTYLTWEQLHALLDELGPARAAHVAYVIASGARRKESFSARRTDVAGAFAELRGTKTEKSARTIPVVSLYEDLMQRALRDAPGKDTLFEPWGNARRDIIRACERAQRKMIGAAARRPWEELSKTEQAEWLAKIPFPKVTWNDLRRTFASLLRQRGVRVDDLADLLGHADTKMARMVYGQDTPERLATAVQRRLDESEKSS